jgi:hypothetical protein
MSTVEDEACESVAETACEVMPVIVGARELVVVPSVSVAGGEGEVGVGSFTAAYVVGVGVGLAVTAVWVVLVVVAESILHPGHGIGQLESFAKIRKGQ